ncbi:Hypothetical predicted protein [Argonauta hians]
MKCDLYMGATVYSPIPLFNNASVTWIQKNSDGRSHLLFFHGEPKSWIKNNTGPQSNLSKDIVHLACDFNEKILIGVDSGRRQIWGIKFIHDKGHMYNIFTGTSAAVRGIAVDWVTNLVYWTDAFYQDIMVASIETVHSRVHVLIDLNLDAIPAGIAVHPAEGFLFWTDMGKKAKLQRSTLSGQYQSTLIDRMLKYPVALAVDHFENRLYILDSGLRRLMSCDLTGDNIVIVHEFSSNKELFGLDIYRDFAFVSELNEFSLYAVSLLSGEIVYNTTLQHQPQGVLTCGPWKQTSKRSQYPPPPSILLLAKKNGLHYVEQNFADANGLSSKMLLEGPYSIQAVAVDASRGIAYFTDSKEKVIYRTSIYQQTKAKAIILAVKTVTGLAFDWLSRNLYWTDSDMECIMVARYNGFNVARLMQLHNSSLRAIAVHPAKRFLYWTDASANNAGIERIGLDGETGRKIISKHSHSSSLAIDFQLNKLVWLDPIYGYIYMSDLNGRHKRVLYQHGAHNSKLLAITVLKKYIVYSNWYYGSTGLYTINKETGRLVGVLKERDPSLALAFLHPNSQTKSTNHCMKNNGGCYHICLPKRNGVRCICAIGFHLDPNGHCTANIVYQEFLLIADQRLRHLYQINLWNMEINALPITPLKQPIDTAFDARDMMVYWTDAEDDSISRSKLDGGYYETLLQDSSISFGEIVIEPSTRLLYFIDNKSGNVGVLSMDTKHYRILVQTGLNHTFGLALDHLTGAIYTTSIKKNLASLWSFHPVHRTIKHVSTDLVDPRGIVWWTDKIYIAVSGNIKAVSTDDLSGGIQQVSVAHVDPYDIAADYMYLYWTDKQSGAVKRTTRLKETNINILLEKDFFIQPVGLTLYKKENRETSPEDFNGYVPTELEMMKWSKPRFAKGLGYCLTPVITLGRLINTKSNLWVPSGQVVAAQCFSGYMPSNGAAMVCRYGNWTHIVECVTDPDLPIHGTLEKGYLKFTSSRLFIVPIALNYINVICIGAGGGGYDGKSPYGTAGDGWPSKFKGLVAEGGKGGSKSEGGAGGLGTVADGAKGGWSRSECTRGGAAGGANGWFGDSRLHPFCGGGGVSECPPEMKGFLPSPLAPGPGGTYSNGTTAGLYGGGGAAMYKMGAGGGGGFSRMSMQISSWDVIPVVVGKPGDASYGQPGGGVVVVSWGWPSFEDL